MAERRTAKDKDDNRPQAIRTSYSFPRMESEALSPRKRASTLQEQGIPAVPTARNIATSPELVGKRHVADVFENHEEEHHAPSPSGTNTPGPELNLPSTFDELPIEIRSLTERFLDSLSAKVHPTPLTSDALSDLFQDFYERAAASISTHIANLSSRIGREKSPTPSNSSKSSGRARAGSGAKRSESSPSYSSGGEMLTASEVADRRKARRLLEAKRLALEEAVERAVCEKVYERIYKHRSTDDDARDEKLRSRTAALALVGIGLKELHVESPTKQDVEEREEEIHHSLAPAREALQRMDEEHYPLGKLKHLTDTHKIIVETLSQLFPASSSADEILPTLIYTLITSPPEGLNVVSNLNFIQRFRSSSKVDGEAAYCLVSLEAAISFLETVDLSSLRADELPEGPGKSSPGPRTPTSDRASHLTPTKASPAQALKPGVSAVTVESTEKSSSPTEARESLPSSPRRTSAPATANNTHTAQQQQQSRRISEIVQAQADRIEAGRDNILNTADKIYESINGTLENSFQFVFGRFKEQQVSGDSPLPKTLEDARKLVSSPHPAEAGEDEMGSGRSSPSPSLDDPLNNNAGPRTDGNNKRMLELIGGQRPPVRDRSVDSARSAASLGSGKRVAFEKVATKEDATPAAGGNLFANINPLNRFGVNVPGFARFGRAGSNPTIPPPPSPAPGQGKLGHIVESPIDAQLSEKQRSRSRESNSGNEEMNAREVLAELRKLKPPRKRFLEVQSAAELRLGEVEELLREYRRLAKGIGEAVAL
ncbi:hypothetical protein LTR37_014226 [Vermiconidia calcicola]|uniref:Uncharacterized protein n=1 Tax=Vermiconidia calcicola TaxID=1690605 RepID=A0ACC3MU51_9PEZI|nr:hypothetical protein LTR37_014226 [Vermiconidia calcicola]